MPDFPAGIRNGLISGKHRRRMGMAVWEFMWLVDHVTEEYQAADGEIRGKVLGGTVIKAERIAEDMEVSANTVQDSIKKLGLAGYIDCRKAAYGYRIEVRNSKKWVRAPTGATDHGVQRTGEQESRRTGETSETPTLQDSETPAPLDIAVREDIADSPSFLLKKGDAAGIWASVLEMVEREQTRRFCDAVRACQPVGVDDNAVTVYLPPEADMRELLSRNAPVIRFAVRQAASGPLNVRFIDPPDR